MFDYPEPLKIREAASAITGGRTFNESEPLNSVDEISETLKGDSDSIHSQNPEQLNSNGNDWAFDWNKAAWYPDNLGSKNNAYYTKFEVYMIDSGSGASVSKTLGDGVYKDVKTSDEKFRAAQTVNDDGYTKYEGQLRANSYKKLDELIALPMPDSIASDHSTMWSKSEGGLVSSLISAGDSIGSAISNGSGMLEGARVANAVMHRAASGITGLFEQMGMEGAKTNLKLLTKRAPNPRNEFLFDGVNNRSFNLQWKFIPSTSAEAYKLRVILEKMKLYMYPELDQSTAGQYYLFPALFDITFMNGYKENEWLYRTSTCAMTNMIINYTGAGQWIATDFEGAPVAWDVTMQFTEIEFLHRDRFKNYGNPNGVAR